MTDEPIAIRLTPGVDPGVAGDAAGTAALRQALASVMRHLHVPEEHQMTAYLDVDTPIGFGRRCPSPSAAAALLLAAEVQPGQRIGVMWAGCGYLVALLSTLGASVVAVEPVAALRERAAQVLASAGLSETVTWAANMEELPESGLDGLIVAGAVPRMPRPWMSAIRQGGRMVVPVQQRRLAALHVYTRQGATSVRTEHGLMAIQRLDDASRG